MPKGNNFNTILKRSRDRSECTVEFDLEWEWSSSISQPLFMLRTIGSLNKARNMSLTMFLEKNAHNKISTKRLSLWFNTLTIRKVSVSSHMGKRAVARPLLCMVTKKTQV